MNAAALRILAACFFVGGATSLVLQVAWTKQLSYALGTTPVPDDALERAREHFDEREMAELTFAVAAIRAWNVLNVGLRKELPEV